MSPLSPDDARGAVRALLVLCRKVGVHLSVHDAAPELLAALVDVAKAESSFVCASVGRADGHEWDGVTTGFGISMFGKHRPVAAKEPDMDRLLREAREQGIAEGIAIGKAVRSDEARAADRPSDAS